MRKIRIVSIAYRLWKELDLGYCGEMYYDLEFCHFLDPSQHLHLRKWTVVVAEAQVSHSVVLYASHRGWCSFLTRRPMTWIEERMIRGLVWSSHEDGVRGLCRGSAKLSINMVHKHWRRQNRIYTAVIVVDGKSERDVQVSGPSRKA